MRIPRHALVLAVALAFLASYSRPVAIEPSATASGNTFKVAYYNIQSGMGTASLTGTCSFERNSNCTDPSTTMNAWGMGVVQAELQASVNSDPDIIALGLSEAWTCASPAAVLKTLGWAAQSGERNGVSLLARYGFAGPPEWLQLDTSLNPNPADTMWVVRAAVCADATCTKSVQVFSAHWYASGDTRTESFERQANATAAFMDRLPATEPRLMIGDLNVWEEPGTVCGQTPVPTAMDILRNAGNLDAWPFLHGADEGYTGMWNRNGCGVPNGYLWKRIDQAWSRNLPAPVSMTRFGMVTPGTCAPSDHAGIIVEYPWPGAVDTTPPLVELTAPAAASVLSGTASVAAAASDNVGVTTVGFTVDGALVAEDTTGPYGVAWDTATVPNGTHTLSAWAEDAAGNRSTAPDITISVDNPVPPPPNVAPISSFNAACTGLNCAFTDQSTDADGSIVGWTWNFGDGSTSAAQNPLHTYAAAGTYGVSLTVTDNQGASSTTQQGIVVSAPLEFSVAATPSSATVVAGGKTTYTISVTVTSGPAVAVTLAVAGLPAHAAGTFTPSSLNGSGSATLSVATKKSTPVGTFNLTVTATAGGLKKTTTMSMTVVRR